jgi:DNA mismatch repair protein MutH
MAHRTMSRPAHSAVRVAASGSARLRLETNLPWGETAPDSEPELLTRARRLSGMTLGELAKAVGRPTPLGGPRTTRKGYVGQLVERALGARGSNHSGPDLATLAIEIKTLPIHVGVPTESTFVCSAPLRTIGEIDWEASPVRAKLRRVLWVPVEASPAVAIETRRVGTAFLWSPNKQQEPVLRDDWDALAGALATGRVPSAREGTVLQVRPKAAHSRVTCSYFSENGAAQVLNPRGFYLRRAFTAQVVRAQWAAFLTHSQL